MAWPSVGGWQGFGRSSGAVAKHEQESTGSSTDESSASAASGGSIEAKDRL